MGNIFLLKGEHSESAAMKNQPSSSNVEDERDTEAGPSSASSSSSAADKRAERMKRLRELHLRRVWPSFLRCSANALTVSMSWCN